MADKILQTTEPKVQNDDNTYTLDYTGQDLNDVIKRVQQLTFTKVGNQVEIEDISSSFVVVDAERLDNFNETEDTIEGVIDAVNEDIKNNAGDITNLKQRLDNVAENEANITLKDFYQNTIDEIESITERLDDHDSTFENVQNELNRLDKIQLTSTQGNLSIEQAFTNLEDKMEELGDNISTLDTVVTQNGSNITDLAERLDKFNNTENTIENSIKELNENITNNQEDISDLQQKTNDIYGITEQIIVDKNSLEARVSTIENQLNKTGNVVYNQTINVNNQGVDNFVINLDPTTEKIKIETKVDVAQDTTITYIPFLYILHNNSFTIGNLTFNFNTYWVKTDILQLSGQITNTSSSYTVTVKILAINGSSGSTGGYYS